MENNSNITITIIQTINTILQNLFSSIDNNLYNILDDITFISSDILTDSYFEKILGSSTSDGILVIANALLFGFLLYYSLRYLLSHFTYCSIDSPSQFIFKIIIFGICINSSYFIISQILDLTSIMSLSIRNIGEELFNKNICFSELISDINNSTLFNNDINNWVSGYTNYPDDDSCAITLEHNDKSLKGKKIKIEYGDIVKIDNREFKIGQDCMLDGMNSQPIFQISCFNGETGVSNIVFDDLKPSEAEKQKCGRETLDINEKLQKVVITRKQADGSEIIVCTGYVCGMK